MRYAAVLVLFGMTTAAQGGIAFTLGNNPQTDENVLLNSGDTGTTILGQTQSGIDVQFSSLIDILKSPSSGQARIEATDGLLNNITISIPGSFFNSLIINPFQGTGTATLTALLKEPDGSTLTSTFSYTLGNGQNFVTMVALDNESIQSITLDAPGGFSDLRQIRISAVVGSVDPHVVTNPEPSTFVMSSILFGMFGAGWSYKRFKQTTTA